MEKARASYVAVSPMQKARPSRVACLANGEGKSFSYVARVASAEGETFLSPVSPMEKARPSPTWPVSGPVTPMPVAG